MGRSEALLGHLGLTEYETRAFLALVTHSSSTADKISTVAKIPLPRVYDTMTSLSARGLVITTRTRPQLFKAIDLDKISILLKDDEKRKMDEKVKNIDETIPQLLNEIGKLPKTASSEEFNNAFAYVRRRANMDSLWESAHKSAKKEIVLFAGDLYWTDKMSEMIKKAIKNGIKYRIIWSVPNSKSKERIKRLTQMGAKLKYSPIVGNLRGIVCDSKKLYIAKIPPKEELQKDFPDFITLVITDDVITKVFKNYFENMWKNGSRSVKKLNR